MQVLELLSNRQNDLNVMILKNLIGRVFGFLLEKDKINFLETKKFFLNPVGISLILSTLDPQKRESLIEQRDIFSNNAVSEIFSDLEKIPHLENNNYFVRICDALKFKNWNSSKESCSLKKFVIKFWKWTIYQIDTVELHYLEVQQKSKHLRDTEFFKNPVSRWRV